MKIDGKKLEVKGGIEEFVVMGTNAFGTHLLKKTSIALTVNIAIFVYNNIPIYLVSAYVKMEVLDRRCPKSNILFIGYYCINLLFI